MSNKKLNNFMQFIPSSRLDIMVYDTTLNY